MRFLVVFLAFALAACSRAPTVATLPGAEVRAAAPPAKIKFCAGFPRFSAVKIESARPGFDCEAAAPYDRLVASLNEIAPSPIPRTTLLLLPRQPRRAIYDVRYRKIELEDPLSGPGIREVNEISLVHEEGHNLFSSFLAAAIPLYGELDRHNEESSDLLFRLMETTTRYGGVDACQDENSACFKEVLRVNAEAEKTEKARDAFVRDRETDLRRLQAHTEALHELYADALVAVYYEDPARLTRVLGDAEACRSFAGLARAAKGKRSSYCEFAELRAPLWRAWLEPRLSNKKALLEELGRGLAEEAALSVRLPAFDRAAVLKRLRARFKV